jgi:quinol-cytochrome oxidoreductase complex cytochrome b subunit
MMAVNKRNIRREPKYDPPYPQDFYAFWPGHVLKALIIMVVIYSAIIILASLYRVPMDPDMPPLPYEGEYIPAPEWYLFLMFQPFWYMTGEDTKWLSLGTFWIPFAVLALLFLVPAIFSKKKSGELRVPMSGWKKAGFALLALVIWVMGGSAVVGSGYPAKTTGCPSCHNPMMGVRQALPPATMGDYYKIERQRQIDLGGYRAGDTSGAGGSYKDANWQLRHFYEPTMTW